MHGVTASSVLLERHHELDLIASFLHASATEDAQRLVLVEGPAGIGKTRLLTETRRIAAEGGIRVLVARGSELEREFAFGVVRQLFEPALADAAARERMLDGQAAGAADVFGSQPADVQGDVSFAVLHALYWLTVNLSADGPILLAIDDLQWCDRASLRLVAYLLRRLEGLPILMAASLRTADPGVDLTSIAEIAGDPLTLCLRPGPLSADAVRDVIRDALHADPDPAFTDMCRSATGGNPLLLIELLKALEAEHVKPDASQVELVRELGPRAVSRAVLLRMSRLSPEAVAVARAAAILGDGTDVRTVAALAGLDEAQAAEATGALARAEILRPDTPLGFIHPLVRDVVYRDIPPGERERQHTRAARLSADAGAPAERIAAHCLVMPHAADQWIVDTLRQAAATAIRKGAGDSAVAYLRRALDEPPSPEQRPQVLLELGLAEALIDGPAAVEHLREGREALTDPVMRAVIANILGRILTFTGHGPEAVEILRQQQTELPAGLDDLQDQLLASLTSVAFFDPNALPLDAPEMRSIEDRAAGEGPGARLLAGVATYAKAMAGHPASECVPLALHTVEGGILVEVDNVSTAFVAGVIVLGLADRPESLETCDAMLAAAHRKGSLFEASGAKIFRGWALLRRGDLEEAEEMERRAFDEVDSWGFVTAQLYPSAFLTEVLIERGDVAGARRASDRAGFADDPPDDPQIAWWLASRIRLLLAEQRFDEALRWAELTRDRLADVNRNPAWLPWRSLAAQALVRLGRPDEAVDLATEELDMARAWGAPGTLGRALRIAATLRSDLSMIEESVSVLDGSLAQLELAKSCLALGTAMRHDRRPTEAREPLSRALELAAACGAVPVERRARDELLATGARPRADAVTGPASLTPSERRVVDLAIAGHTNRDIAQQLYVTPKTVEVHLGNAYRKLGVRSRRELGSVLSGS